MTKFPLENEMTSPQGEVSTKFDEITLFDLRLVSKKVKIKFSPYKISTQLKNMSQTETIAISSKGILFSSTDFYEVGSLMRVWVEIPDYWSRKSKYVDYRHTDAPSHFQILTRVVQCKNEILIQEKYHLLCETLNIDSIDNSVLQDYLVSSAGAKK